VKSTDDLVEELLRAADGSNSVSDQEKQKLLERAVDAVRDLRDQIRRWPGSHVIDAADVLVGTAMLLKEGQCPRDQSEAALLDAADMIRDLLLVRESGIETKAEE
jgi:CCR4-NOT transcriptional regulation complex NOT5 subunit